MEHEVSTVVVYALQEGQVLLMHRNKEPNLGMWTAPGGKVEPGESPHETARREMVEETGLGVGDLYLRGLCTLVSPLQERPWFLFVFVTTRFQGVLRADRREGDLAWIPLEEYLTTLPIPQADAIFAPRVLTITEGCFQAKFVCDVDLNLVEWVAY
jgi:8-oxo-dGTP pyrophosphatase MutT (NUDIX family)